MGQDNALAMPWVLSIYPFINNNNNNIIYSDLQIGNKREKINAF